MQLHARMAGRDPGEAHRASTPLELFFDLTFVVAVSQAASGLHHGFVEGHVGDALAGFPLVFFAIWWAWMNFTWFASAYDTDDAVYRIAVLVQLTGVLILAAGVPRALAQRDFGITTLGYVTMRLAMVGQWLRAAAPHPDGRPCALRYAIGITVAQIGWVARLALPDSVGIASVLVLVAVELAVPFWAEGAGRTPWHPGHIAERYCLFTLIVLGESVLSATVGVQVALDGTTRFSDLAPVVIGGILTVFFMWWLYFDMPAEQSVARVRAVFTERLSGGFVWGYGHYVVFGAAAAVGAGLAVAVDGATHHSALTHTQTGLAITVPVTVFVIAVWGLHYGDKAPGPLRTYAVPVASVLILASSFTPEPVLATGLLLAVLVAAGVTARAFQPARPEAARPSASVGAPPRP
jgi:low temperature requirement protein LtrA